MNLAYWIGSLAALAGCYFAACHSALKLFSRKRLADLLQERGGHDHATRLLHDLPSIILATGVLRTSAALLVVLCSYSIVDAYRTNPYLTYPLAFFAAAVVVSVFIVAIPVSWARYRRERLLAWSLPILRVAAIALWPVTAVLKLFDPVVRRISGVDLLDEDEGGLSDEVLSVVEEHEAAATIDEQQKEMLEAVFDLPNTTAGEIMTPRTDVKGIEVTADLNEVKQAILDFGHSRIPVYEEDLDHIHGLLYAKDLIHFVGDGRVFDLVSVLRDALLVPESKSVRELLAEFKARKVHIAIVLDEYGGTAGLVTIEDILEEIVGEIQDEYELRDVEPTIDRTDEDTADVDARVDIDDLNDALDAELPEDEDYDTVGGYVVATLGRIPSKGDTFEADGFRFTVTDAERTKVKRVRIERLADEPDPLAQRKSA